MTPENLNELITRSCNRDENAFRRLVESHQAMIYTLCFRLLCDEEDARDAVQETFIKVWLNLPGFDVSRRFSTWVYAIATNYCYDRLKSRNNKPVSRIPAEELSEVFQSGNGDALDQLIDRETGRLIASLTEQLSPKQKTVFTLSDLEGLDTTQIQQITGFTIVQIKSNLYLARQVLRKQLNKYSKS